MPAKKNRHIHEIKTLAKDKCNFVLLSAGRPKIRGVKSAFPLVSIRGQKLVDLQIEVIRKSCKQPLIYVVVGHEHEECIDHLRDKHPDVKIIHNNNANDTDVFASLKIALNVLDPIDTVIVYGDRIFNTPAISPLSRNRSVLFTHTKDRKSKTPGLSYNEKGLINISYGLEAVWSEIIYLCGRDFITFRDSANNSRRQKIYSILRFLSDMSKKIHFDVASEGVVVKTIKDLKNEHIAIQ